MEQFNNINTLFEAHKVVKKTPLDIYALIDFTIRKQIDRDLICSLPLTLFNKNKETNEYIFKYHNKEYPFKLMTDLDIQKSDIKTLKTSKRISGKLGRTLKLACSLDLINPRVNIGCSFLSNIEILILYQENGIDMVMDYSRNLVMKKDDYYELFKLKSYNIVDKFELYRLYDFMEQSQTHEYIFEYLLFGKEILEDLNKKGTIGHYHEKYDDIGINFRNYTIIGNNFDNLFLQNNDGYNKRDEKIYHEVNEFTENPINDTKHITILGDGYYLFKDIKYGSFKFRLISDIMQNKEAKDLLLSNNRYGECHINANKLAFSFTKEDKDNGFVIGGKFPINDKDNYYHSWVEIDNKDLVLDFNHNIIMHKDDYYKFYKVVPINRTPINDMKHIFEIVLDEFKINFHPAELNYFGKEILNDLNKNKHLLQKTK